MRKLASIQEIIDIQPIPNADAIEVVTVEGWKIVVKKGEFKVGDKIVYVEIDSILPDKPEFEFLRTKKFKIKTIKLRGQISQGIVFPLDILPNGTYNIGDDVTDIIGVTKYDPEILFELDDTPVINNNSFINKFTPKFIRNFLFKYFPGIAKSIFSTKELKYNFPSFVAKTDETRCQNIQGVLTKHKGELLVGTEKCDGTSITIYLNNGIFGVCSRSRDIKYDANDKYWKTVIDLGIENKMRNYFGNTNIVLQGELYGPAIQGNKYKMKHYNILFFNIFNIDTQTYYSNYEIEKTIKELGLDSVPIIYRDLPLTDNIDELLKLAEGKSVINNSGVEREGIVWRLSNPNNYKKGTQFSFKSVSNKFLLKSND